jgi:cellulose synthase/poly-beta-1,6-N-acetylglucosamine synthase-like glycosyltransferase
LTPFLILLYTLVIPYIGLLVLMIVGLLRPEKRPVSHEAPSVSVIIPARNEADRIAETLVSLAAQRYAGRLEFILVSDRSTDATGQIMARFAARDPRFKLVQVTQASRRFSPKVNAVNTGIQRSRGEIILTSDADCRYHPDWVTGMVSYFAPDVAMVVGCVESGRATPLQRFEAVDWLSLMLIAIAFARFGWAFAGSANNQAYRRSAFKAIGGFGASGSCPSGDEDLLIQRMGRRQAGRVVFALAPEARVLTRPMPNLAALLAQRRRWVSRYRHMRYYHPVFLAGILILGLRSVVLSAAILLSVIFPPLAPYVFSLWGAELLVEWVGMHLGENLLGRRDLWGLPTLLWSLLHPFFIATVALWATVRSGEWLADASEARVGRARRKKRSDSRL